jgi:hypothetical protein
MPRSPGCTKTGGRQKGGRNLRTLTRHESIKMRLEMLEMELDLNPGSLDPIEGLARIAGDKNTPLDVRVDCLKNIAPYVYPKLATVSVKGDDEGPPIRHAVLDVTAFMKDPQLLEAAQRVALAAASEGSINTTDDEGPGLESSTYDKEGTVDPSEEADGTITTA